MIDVFYSGRITSLDMAAASGSNRIFTDMNRGHIIERYQENVQQQRRFQGKISNGIDMRELR